MTTAKLFTDGRHQAVRLPKEFRFEGDQVGIKRMGKIVVLYPVDAQWSLLLESLTEFTDDFLADRRQPAAAELRADQTVDDGTQP